MGVSSRQWEEWDGAGSIGPHSRLPRRGGVFATPFSTCAVSVFRNGRDDCWQALERGAQRRITNAAKTRVFR
jgi:hypothetical protein